MRARRGETLEVAGEKKERGQRAGFYTMSKDGVYGPNKRDASGQGPVISTRGSKTGKGSGLLFSVRTVLSRAELTGCRTSGRGLH